MKIKNTEINILFLLVAKEHFPFLFSLIWSNEMTKTEK